jgi:hypothetical protein
MKRRRSSSRKRRIRSEKTRQEPVSAEADKPAVAEPLSGEALEAEVIGAVIAPLRASDARLRILKRTHGAPHEAIEEILRGPRALEAIAQAAAAYDVEQAPGLLPRLYAEVAKDRAAGRAVVIEQGLAGRILRVAAGLLAWGRESLSVTQRGIQEGLLRLFREEAALDRQAAADGAPQSGPAQPGKEESGDASA